MKTFNNFIQNTVRGSRNLINNVRNGFRRFNSKPSNFTGTPPQNNQNYTFSWEQEKPITYFSPAKNVITQEQLPNINFNESSIQSGTSTYPVVESNWVPMGVRKSEFSKYFRFKDLRKVQDDLSRGNLFLDYEGASLRDGDRVLTGSDFRNVRPATEVLGPKVFDANAKGYGVYGPGNIHPHAERDGEKFLGLLNADEAHILAMGGDDIARRIMQNGKPRVLFRRYERTHPLKQQELNETAKNHQRTPRFNSLLVASNTTGNSTNIPSQILAGNNFSKATHGRLIPVFSGAEGIGPHYDPNRHAIFMYNNKEYADKINSINMFQENKDLLSLKSHKRRNDSPLLAKNRLFNMNPFSKETSYMYAPTKNDIGQTLDTGTLFHELMHSEMADVNLSPYFSNKNLNSFIKSNKYLPSQGYFDMFDESGIVVPEEGYATSRASELSRANAIMKDVIVNSIRHRVEALAPKRIPGWANMSPEERAAVIADVTLDLSENTRLANHIMRSWGFEGKDIRIPMSYIKIDDPTYMYELLRAAEGIRKSRVPLSEGVEAVGINRTKRNFPHEVLNKIRELKERSNTPGSKQYKNLAELKNEAAKQVRRDQYNKLFAKTWVQTAPAIMAPIALPSLYSRLASNDQYID